jgi:hypothetical protein
MDYQSFEANVERVAEQTSGWSRYVGRTFFFVTSAEYSLDPFLMFREVYPQYWLRIDMRKIPADGPSLPESVVSMEKDPRSVVFVMPTLPEEWRQGIQVSLESAGYRLCPVVTPSGKWQYDLFVSKEMDWVCSALH